MSFRSRFDALLLSFARPEVRARNCPRPSLPNTVIQAISCIPTDRENAHHAPLECKTIETAKPPSLTIDGFSTSVFRIKRTFCVRDTSRGKHSLHAIARPFHSFPSSRLGTPIPEAPLRKQRVAVSVMKRENGNQGREQRAETRRRRGRRSRVRPQRTTSSVATTTRSQAPAWERPSQKLRFVSSGLRYQL